MFARLHKNITWLSQSSKDFPIISATVSQISSLPVELFLDIARYLRHRGLALSAHISSALKKIRSLIWEGNCTPCGKAYEGLTHLCDGWGNRLSPNDDTKRLTHFEYTRKYMKLVMPSYDERQFPVINFFMRTCKLFDWERSKQLAPPRRSNSNFILDSEPS